MDVGLQEALQHWDGKSTVHGAVVHEAYLHLSSFGGVVLGFFPQTF